jgi:hypothetical protein
VEILAVLGMVSDCTDPTTELHVPYLTLSRIEEYSILVQPIFITVLLATFSNE